MLKKIISSFVLSFHNIRSHFFHTMLSVLGIVIGVAALVAILSMIDGMEQYAKDQISTTTDLKVISVFTDSFKKINGITVRKDSVTFLEQKDFIGMQKSLTHPAKPYIFLRMPKEMSIENDTTKTAAHSTGVIGVETENTLLTGRTFTEEDINNKADLCLLSESLAKTFAVNEKISDLIGKKIVFDNRKLTVIGVINLKFAKGPELFFPFSLFTSEDLRKNPPQCIVEAENIEDVPAIKEELLIFLNKQFSGNHDFKVITNEARVAQAAQGFQLFRIIMGMIVGISVLVGGIGVMNVLLISVTERTTEIGIRKAVGANKRDILMQFLSESITISFFGSLVGLILGILGTMIIVPIINSLTQMPFQAAYTWNTFLVISILAIVVGVLFGTYPALRAARLDPVEAIRKNE